MGDCAVCGSSQFEKHDGFFYCVECQTQSQDMREQVYEFRVGDTTHRKNPTKKTRQAKKKNPYDRGPHWTSWEAFNYMLRGMTEELMELEPDAEVESLVLALWACYLSKNKVAFVSRFKELPPRLGYPYRYRDAKVVYDVDAVSFKSKSSRRKRRKSANSGSDVSLLSSKTLKKRLLTADYESHLSATLQSNTSTSMLDETLESLGTSFESEGSDLPPRNTLRSRYMMEDAFWKHKKHDRCAKSFAKKHLLASAFNKPKLLAILHLALLMARSQVQLSDLLRFIDEGSLSFSCLSQFLPADWQFASYESAFINCSSDRAMPAHQKTCSLTAKMALSINISYVQSPDRVALLRRYTNDLQLPDGFTDMAIKLLKVANYPYVAKLSGRKPIPCFEAQAVAPVLVLFKLLLGMDGSTEYTTSHFANTFNSVSSDGSYLFSFTEWRRMLECRAAVLSEHHYPTRDQTRPDTISGSVQTATFFQGIHKDSHLQKRVSVNATVSHIDMDVESEIAKVLESLTVRKSEPRHQGPSFRSSLTPNITHLQHIVDHIKATGGPDPSWARFLQQDWLSSDVTYLLEPDKFQRLLAENGVKIIPSKSEDWINSHMRREDRTTNIFDTLTENEQESWKLKATLVSQVLKTRRNHHKRPDVHNRYRPVDREEEARVRTDHVYWRLVPPPGQSSWLIKVFETEIMSQFPPTWQWLLTLFSRMLRVTTSTIYSYVLEFEHRVILINE